MSTATMPRERPILFSAPMVRAILTGTKTQTRRVVKPQPSAEWVPVPELIEIHGRDRDGNLDPEIVRGLGYCSGDGEEGYECRYGAPGDRLWVRETCRAEERCADLIDCVRFLADDGMEPIENTQAAADEWLTLYHYRGQRGATVPPIHMPRWACRIVLEITDVRVQRLHDISQEDAVAEGIDDTRDGKPAPGRIFYAGGPRDAFAVLWQSINGSASWNANPWVWALTFRRLAYRADRQGD